MPNINSKIPTTIVKYFRKVADLLISFSACVVNKPTSKNGIPNPSAYDINKTNPKLGFVTAKANTLPRIALTQGVHPTANAAPNTNDVT